jgi:hypothetical protein
MIIDQTIAPWLIVCLTVAFMVYAICTVIIVRSVKK